VTDLLDKWGVFRARLFRESCVFHRGNYVKVSFTDKQCVDIIVAELFYTASVTVCIVTNDGLIGILFERIIVFLCDQLHS